MMSTRKKLVILGCGSYNPLTNMHLRMFEIAKINLTNQGNYDVIGGIISPVNDNYVSKKYIAPAKHRCAMISIALKPLLGIKHWVQLDDWECKQDRWMKTVEVLRYHHDKLNSNSNEKIHVKLLCGSDMFDSFNVPNLWRDEDIEEIVRDFGLIVITRSGTNPWNIVKNSSKSPILVKFEDNINIIEEKVRNSISSTFIREAISKNESVRYLMDDSVIEYINRHKLYL